MTPSDGNADPELHLRDRIAAAILRADVMPSTDTDPYIEMADAVIADLGLRFAPGPPGKHRYVTDWKANK